MLPNRVPGAHARVGPSMPAPPLHPAGPRRLRHLQRAQVTGTMPYWRRATLPNFGTELI